MIGKLKFILLVCIVAGCSSDNDSLDNDPRHLWAMFKLREYDYIMSLDTSRSAIFKGFVHEYIDNGEKNIDKAREQYSKISSSRGRYRLYMLCFIYCSEELDHLYNSGAKDFPEVRFLHAFARSINNKDCSDIDIEACKLAINITGHIDLQNPYYSAGGLMYKTIKTTENGRKKKDLEIIYYMIKKASKTGSKESLELLSCMYTDGIWVPKDLLVANRLFNRTISSRCNPIK